MFVEMGRAVSPYCPPASLPRVRGVMGLVASLGLSLLLVSCGGVEASSTPPPHPSASPGGAGHTPPASAAPATSPLISPSGATVSSSGCPGYQLSVSVVSDGVATGHIADILLIRNVGSDPCQISGYPGVDGLLADGSPVHTRRTIAGFIGGIRSGSIPILSLAPTQVASAIVEGSDNPTSGSTCPKFSAFLVTPPNTTTTSRLTPPGGSFDYCRDELEVHPVVAGATGDQG
jgi:Protein of unknown function (DUF4232)